MAEARVSGRQRFPFVDQFRGTVGIMMALGHCSGFFNSAWKTLNMFDPFFESQGQFALRYMGYLCAPGFLMMNGMVSWYSFTRRVAGGASAWKAKWHLIQRGLFLVLVQVTWVNAAWIGFRRKDPLPWGVTIALGLAAGSLAFRMKKPLWVKILVAALVLAATPFITVNMAHIGIIAAIGLSMCILALIVDTPWWFRLLIAMTVFFVHPAMLHIKYDPEVLWQMLVMETFVTAGKWNKYPVLPWFALATMGSVMATGWLQAWKTAGKRIGMSFAIGLAALIVATAVRYGRGYGNLSPFDQFPHYSFFLDIKYPPSLYHGLWFFGSVTMVMGLIQILNHFYQPSVQWLAAIGKVPLFFYCIHIALLSIVADRLGVYYRQGGVAASLITWPILVGVLYPVVLWFGALKARTKIKAIQMI